MRNLDSRSHAFALRGTPGVAIKMAPGQTATQAVGGLRNGSHRVTVDGRTRARIVVGSQPGP